MIWKQCCFQKNELYRKLPAESITEIEKPYSKLSGNLWVRDPDKVQLLERFPHCLHSIERRNLRDNDIVHTASRTSRKKGKHSNGAGKNDMDGKLMEISTEHHHKNHYSHLPTSLRFLPKLHVRLDKSGISP
jgi:hypothetical protein